MNQTETFVISRLHRDDLKIRFPEIPETTIEALTDEISMCLRYHRQLFPDDPVCRAVLLGGETRSKHLCHAVARSLRLPTQIADPFARLSKDRAQALGLNLSEAQPGWSTPLGLCLMPHGG